MREIVILLMALLAAAAITFLAMTAGHTVDENTGNDQQGNGTSVSYAKFIDTSTHELNTGRTLLKDIKDEIGKIVASRNPDTRGLLNAMLLTAPNHTALNAKETIVMLANTLGKVETFDNPIPEMFTSDDTVLESDGSPVPYREITQENYAKTLGTNEIIRTYYPRTRQGVVNIVKRAKKEDARVRASGLRHSWNHWVWGVDNIHEDVSPTCYNGTQSGNVDYFIAMVPYELSDPLYFLRADIEGWRKEASELTFVEGPIDKWTDEDGTEHASVKVGAAALSQFLMEWELENGWMLPTLPMTPLFTIGGVVSTSSHGAGLKHPPVSEQVIALEYVDEKGEIQYVDDPKGLEAAAGSYGLLGILLSVTLRMDKMTLVTYEWQSVFTPIEEVISKSPDPLPDSTRAIFEDVYYQSWYSPVDFGRPSRFPKMFLNTIREGGNKTNSVRLHETSDIELSTAKWFLYGLINKIMLEKLEEAGKRDQLYWMHTLIERQLEYFILTQGGGGSSGPKVTTAVEATHWIRGMHSYDVIRNFEINIPIGDDGTGRPDWSTVQDAFWLYHTVVNSYESQGLFPHDLYTEFRFVAESHRILDPYYGNKFGALAMDMTCTKLVPEWLWNQFKPRHHLGKELPVGVGGMSSADFFRATFSDQIDLFKERYKSIVVSRGSHMEDSLRRFSTKFFDSIFLDGCQGPRVPCQ